MMNRKVVKENLVGFGNDVRNIPSEMRQWWIDSHRWDQPKFEYTYDEEVVDGRLVAVAMHAHEMPDYTLWRRLGMLSDALLILIVVLILLLFV